MSRNEPSIISVRGVSKHFGAVHAVDNVDLEIQRGEFFSLLTVWLSFSSESVVLLGAD